MMVDSLFEKLMDVIPVTEARMTVKYMPGRICLIHPMSTPKKYEERWV
jgi:hypothetical protein